MKKPRLRLALMACLLLAQPALAEEKPQVLASIKPLHSLVAGVMEGVAKPQLLVKGSQSLHGFQLSPSQRSAIQSASVIFYLDPHFERFLNEPLKDIGFDTQAIALSGVGGLKLLPLRSGGVWDAHQPHPNSPFAQESNALDYHFWLSPANASLMVMQIAQTLSETYPEHRATFGRNAAGLLAAITTLDMSLNAQLAPVKDKKFLLFHDATQYFENHYGLHAAGSITLTPDAPATPARLKALRKRLAKGDVVCVLSEPGANEKLLDTATEKRQVERGAIDPEGAAIPAGPDLYAALMQNLAQALVNCLSTDQPAIRKP